jgi:hypothetical protein
MRDLVRVVRYSLDHGILTFLVCYRYWKQGNIAGRTGVPCEH